MFIKSNVIMLVTYWTYRIKTNFRIWRMLFNTSVSMLGSVEAALRVLVTEDRLRNQEESPGTCGLDGPGCGPYGHLELAPTLGEAIDGLLEESDTEYLFIVAGGASGIKLTLDLSKQRPITKEAVKGLDNLRSLVLQRMLKDTNMEGETLH